MNKKFPLHGRGALSGEKAKKLHLLEKLVSILDIRLSILRFSILRY